MQFVITLLAASVLPLAPSAFGQLNLTAGTGNRGGQPSAYRLFVDARPFRADVAGATGAPVDELARLILADLTARGYWFASLDSVVALTDRVPEFYVSAGKPVRVEAVEVSGMHRLDSTSARAGFASQPGEVFDETVLNSDIVRLMRRYAAAGLPLASATYRVRTIRPAESDSLTAVVELTIVEGTRVDLIEVRLAPRVRTRPKLVARLAGLRLGGAITTFDPIAIQRSLEATGLFESVGEVKLEADLRGRGVLTIPLVESAPGSFDLALGYLSKPGGGGSVVGNGHIVLRNLFGGARQLSMRLDRLSGRASVLDAAVEDPYLIGSVVGASLGFRGEQRDSTFAKQSYRLDIRYRIAEGLFVSAGATRDVTRPGQAGLAIVGGRQLVPRSDALFAGIGIRFSSVDEPANPRRGIAAESDFRRGSKEITTVRVIGADTVARSESFAQESLRAMGRVYVSLGQRQVVALGGDAEALLSPEYDDSDLLKLGGASTLRGYNEEQFDGRLIARGLAEYRYRLDRLSYVFAFVDVGYVESVPGAHEQSNLKNVYPGFGIGIQFETAIGLMNATYGMNPDEGPQNGKVHIGLSFAL